MGLPNWGMQHASCWKQFCINSLLSLISVFVHKAFRFLFLSCLLTFLFSFFLFFSISLLSWSLYHSFALSLSFSISPSHCFFFFPNWYSARGGNHTNRCSVSVGVWKILFASHKDMFPHRNISWGLSWGNQRLWGREFVRDWIYKTVISFLLFALVFFPTFPASLGCKTETRNSEER